MRFVASKAQATCNHGVNFPTPAVDHRGRERFEISCISKGPKAKRYSAHIPMRKAYRIYGKPKHLKGFIPDFMRIDLGHCTEIASIGKRIGKALAQILKVSSL